MAIYLSYSGIGDFLACSMRYYYRVNQPECAIQTESMVKGSIIHRAIEMYWNKSKDEMYNFIRNECEIENIPFGDMYRLADKFYQNFHGLLSDNDDIERKFSIKYCDDVYIVGKYDRIVRDKGKAYIFDWKTSKYLPKDISNNIQFILYYWAYAAENGNPPDGMYYISLYHGSIVKYAHNKVYHDLLFNSIIPNIIDSLENGRFVHNGIYSYKTCDNCSFREHCFNNLGVNNELDSKTPHTKQT